MEKTRHVIAALVKDDSGAAAVEYGLIVALISIMVVLGAIILGGALNEIFTGIGNFLAEAAATIPGFPAPAP